MKLRFTDNWNHEGVIQDDFSVDYAGPEPVEDYVETVVEKAASKKEAAKTLIIEINDELGIQEIRKIDE